MTSKPVAFLMADLGVTKTHSRPHVSDDNPYSESQFRTMKYRPEFPDRFGSIQDSRAFCQKFFAWYNDEHRHSGLGLLTRPWSITARLRSSLHSARSPQCRFSGSSGTLRPLRAKNVCSARGGLDQQATRHSTKDSVNNASECLKCVDTRRVFLRVSSLRMFWLCLRKQLEDGAEPTAKWDEGQTAVLKQLQERGVGRGRAVELVREYPAGVIQDQIEYADYLLAGDRRGRFNNPAGLLSTR